jgi:signal transduction histidine kinase/CheY-like chemotaxis protein
MNSEHHRQLVQRYFELSARFETRVESHVSRRWRDHWFLNEAGEGVAVLKGSGILMANRRFRALCSRSRKWAQVSPAETAPHGSLLEAVFLMEKGLEEDSAPRTALLRSDGAQPTYVEAEVRCLEDGAERFLGAVLRDVTDRERLWQERAASDQRDEFLATLAHELRNPLSPITAAAELILRYSDDGRVHGAAETILRQARHQARILEDLMDSARVREGKILLRRERVDLVDVLREAAGATEDYRRRQSVFFSFELPEQPVWVNADRTRLVQAVVNLLNNAAKFTAPGGENWLEAETGKETAWVRVRDTGIGIPPDVLPRIFEVFTQAELPAGNTSDGLGIGLSLVKKLADAHGGGVVAHSDGPGRGALFTLWLPLAETETSRQSAVGSRRPGDGSGLFPGPVPEPLNARAPQPPTPEAAPRPEPLPRQEAPGREPRAGAQRRTPARVLVVEDNRHARVTLCELLETAGCVVFSAPDGVAGLEVALRERPDVVVSDLGMPQMDGFDLADVLRPQLPEARLIALTGRSLPQEEERARQCGFDDYLVKPLDFAQLLAQVSPVPPPL